jgi:ABC-2 type transport system ATP-binding protein
MNDTTPIRIERLSHHYRERQALREVSLEVSAGTIAALLGPNGGGKTTLFRVLCTSMIPAGGRALVCGHDVVREAGAVRRLIGVVFQSPSLDVRLTVRENLVHQGHLYGMRGSALDGRIRGMLERLGVADRAGDLVGSLSGGLARRVDLVRGLLHHPRVLLLDEPTTGLDPHARWEFWKYLDDCRRQEGLTVLLATHYMAEADRCDRVAIIDEGRLVVTGSPEELKKSISGECLTLEAGNPEALAEGIGRRFGLRADVVDGRVRIERQRAHEFIPELVEAFPDGIDSVSLSKPTLEEVFIHQTGRRLTGAPAHE